MSDQDLIKKLNCIADKIEKSNKRKNWIHGLMSVTFLIFTVTVIWKASAFTANTENAIDYLMERSIEKTDYNNVKMKADIGWRHALNIPSSVPSTRGGNISE